MKFLCLDHYENRGFRWGTAGMPGPVQEYVISAKQQSQWVNTAVVGTSRNSIRNK